MELLGASALFYPFQQGDGCYTHGNCRQFLKLQQIIGEGINPVIVRKHRAIIKLRLFMTFS